MCSFDILSGEPKSVARLIQVNRLGQIDQGIFGLKSSLSPVREFIFQINLTVMPQQDIEFLQQFRNADIDLPYEDRQLGNVYFRHFKGSRKGKSALEDLIENLLAHSVILDALTGKMEKDDGSLDSELTAFLQKLQKTLTTFSRNEPASAERLKKLAAEVELLAHFVRQHQTRTQPLLLDALMNISAQRKAARSSVHVGSRSVKSMQVLVRRYRDTLCRFQDVLSEFVEGESERTGKMMVISPVGSALLNLSALIKSRIAAAETSFNGLGEWKLRLRLAERQGSYN